MPFSGHGSQAMPIRTREGSIKAEGRREHSACVKGSCTVHAGSKRSQESSGGQKVLACPLLACWRRYSCACTPDGRNDSSTDSKSEKRSGRASAVGAAPLAKPFSSTPFAPSPLLLGPSSQSTKCSELPFRCSCLRPSTPLSARGPFAALSCARMSHWLSTSLSNHLLCICGGS